MDHKHHSRTGYRRIATALLLVAALLAVACGGSSGADDSGVATLGGSRGDDGGGSGSGRTKDPLDAMLAYAKCMRDRGVDIPDPKVGEGGVIQIGPGPGEGGAPDEDFLAADEKCRHLLAAGEQNISEEDQAIMNDAMLEFVECMRAEGIDMPDPQDGGMVWRVGDENAPDVQDPDFRAADDKCRPILAEAERRAGVSIGESSTEGGEG